MKVAFRPRARSDRRDASNHGDCRRRLIAITGYGQGHDIVRSQSAGFDVHLIKPVELPAVIDAIEGGN
ncbi:MAG TPA: hypothetical protein VHC69_33155 [Polyangiaceae bacterium]|nr:hypothetical protein [Polyangiaceae bacterium]